MRGAKGDRFLDSCAIFSNALMSFCWVPFNSSVRRAYVLVNLAVVARLEAVAVAKFAIALMVSLL